MSRHSLPSSDEPRHGVADDAADDPRITVPRPRTPSDSRHAAGATANLLDDAAAALSGAPTSRHAITRPAGASRHALADGPITGSVPPVAVPAPRTEPSTAGIPAVDGTDAGSTDTRPDTADEVPPTRAARRHAAPHPHRRRAHARPDETSGPGRGRRLLGGRPRAAAVLLTAVVALVALPTVGSASVDQCRWQVAAHDLLVSLDGRTDHRSEQLRRALRRAGIGAQLPAGCAAPAPAPAAVGSAGSPAPTTAHRAPRSTTPTSAPTTKPSASKPTTAAPAPTTTAPVSGATGTGITAAAAQGWGTPTKSDDFTAGLGQWGIYDGSGHAGNGRRTPSAVTTANGVMTMTGDASGNTGGMAWGSGQKYGRWEARVRSTAGSYHPVMLLWPDAENWPVGGEVDWMEISDPARQVADTFLHYGASNNQVQGDVQVDATQWHNWAVEWTPQGITTYLDGKAWWSTKNTSILPPGPMHMTIQLDNFGGRNTATQMQVDWVRQYNP